MSRRRLVAAWAVVPAVLLGGLGAAAALHALGLGTARDAAYVAVCALLPVAASIGWHLSGSDRGEALVGGLASSLALGPVLILLTVPLSELGQPTGATVFLVAAGVWLGAAVLAALAVLVREMFRGQTGRVVGLGLLCPLAVGLAAAAVWWFDTLGLGVARDTAYVAAAALVPLSVVPALRAATPDRSDVVVYRASEAAITFGLVTAFVPLLAAWLGHGFGAVTVGVAAGIWFVLGWVGVARNSHLVPAGYGEDQWAP